MKQSTVATLGIPLSQSNFIDVCLTTQDHYNFHHSEGLYHQINLFTVVAVILCALGLRDTVV